MTATQSALLRRSDGVIHVYSRTWGDGVALGIGYAGGSLLALVVHGSANWYRTLTVALLSAVAAAVSFLALRRATRLRIVLDEERVHFQRAGASHKVSRNECHLVVRPSSLLPWCRDVFFVHGAGEILVGARLPQRTAQRVAEELQTTLELRAGPEGAVSQ